MDCGPYHGDGNLKGSEKGQGGGRNSLWVIDARSDGGSVSMGDLAGTQSDGQILRTQFQQPPEVDTQINMNLLENIATRVEVQELNNKLDTQYKNLSQMEKM